MATKFQNKVALEFSGMGDFEKHPLCRGDIETIFQKGEVSHAYYFANRIEKTRTLSSTNFTTMSWYSIGFII